MTKWKIADEYDRRAYEQILRALSKEPNWASRAGGRVGGAIGSIGRKVAAKVPPPATEATERVIRMTLAGLRSLTIDPAFRSVSTKRILRTYERADSPVETLIGVSHLPLRTIDSVMPPLRWRYSVGVAVEGAGAGAAITGAELLASLGSVASAGAAVAPGIGTVASAMATDAATVLAASARVVAHIGAYFGYDTRLPEEQIFALSIINWASASGEAAKNVAFHQLSQITQELARRAPWAQLGEHAIVPILDKMFVKLGFRLTKEKLGQVIPVLGIAVGAGINAQILYSTATDAMLAYRLRHLIEKYHLDPEADKLWTDRPLGPDVVEDEVDMPKMLEAASHGLNLPDCGLSGA